MNAPKPVLVASSAQLAEAAAKLGGASRYYLDTEFDFAGPVKKLCLIQVSRGTGEIFLIDPLALTALEPLGRVLARTEVEWVLHAGDQDVALLRDALHWAAFPRLFDTQVAWALLGAEYPVSLAYLLYRILGLRSSKSEQAGPWMTRPLTREQEDYAASDVDHLPALRDWLSERLEKLGRLELAMEVSADTIVPPPVSQLTLEDFRNAWQLDAAGQAVLLYLIDWWNGLSLEERKEGPGPKTFLAIAKTIPETGAELSQVRGIYFPWARRHGDAFAGKLAASSARAAREGFVPLEPPPYNTFERIVAGGWIRKAVAEVSAELGVAPELAFPERVIRDMIQAVEEKKSNAAAAGALVGWRERVLRAPLVARLPK